MRTQSAESGTEVFMTTHRKRICSLFIALLLSLTGVFIVFPEHSGTGESHAADLTAAEKTAYNGKSPYYIMVNRQMNTVTVYGVGDDGRYSVPLKAMIASCGRAGHETPTGTFSTPDSRYKWRLMVDGTYGQYASRIHGSILFHSICYTSADKNTMISSEYDALGSFASRGCVRLQTADAKWIYDNCPTGTLVTIYDSSYPGALGKPKRAVESVSGSANSRWDPTDPASSNPWKLNITSAVSGTGSGSVKGTGAYRYGTNVTLTAVPAEHCVFTGWYDEDGNYLSSDSVYSFTLDREQKLTASFRRQASVTAAASASGKASGSCSVDPGTQVTVKAEPASGSTAAFTGWYDRYGNFISNETSYSFTADNDTELYAMYEGDNFGDVPADVWYKSYVDEAVSRGITSGVTPVIFDAGGSFTRAMAVQMIARAAGADLSASGSNPFSDVPADQWYAGAVRWAYENGIVSGVSENKFAPNQKMSRQDMLVIMGRYMSYVEKSTNKEEKSADADNSLASANTDSSADDYTDGLGYTDSADISDYAREWIVYAAQHSLVSGYDDNTLRPKAILTRAEGTAFTVRMMRSLDN